ncbi:ABC transport system ATP-binding protein [Thermoplasma volcanium GSS1]|uniref:ABC transport system ATP-binding protein n=1 Tax=Thermoplasma volcanium (strain ATCC 51530 / DSM 4299 / JCM 9571 / NBRC 15438 / GSS1) TaxID=273116 RepID=Q97CS9_THEVO|nr:ABC transporter ATP-binding protein [Thermoplasma volcanium]BAB59164.1 ABC transport system ATP-binding protein [Thermoplasma volcanium GSS1]
MNCAIEIEDLYMYYGEKPALKGVNLTIPSGSIYGILGPNGSGKTTLMKILVSLLSKKSGRVSVCGLDVDKDQMKIKEIAGYIPETPVLYESMTPLELFDFVGSVRHIPVDSYARRLNALIDAFSIKDYLNEFIGSLSFGNKQKVAIISALVHDPKVLIVDEGMNGLDPRSARIFKDILMDMKNRGKIVVFSTHILEIAENLCDSVAILYEGSIVANGTIRDLESSAPENSQNLEDIFLKLTNSEDLGDVVKSLRGEVGD